MPQTEKGFSRPQKTILAIAALLAGGHLFWSAGHYLHFLYGHATQRAEPGSRYADLKPFLANQKTVGYMTDRPLSPADMSVRNFLSAQYQLAPAILEDQHPDQKMVIIDGSQPSVAMKLLREYNLAPVYVNPWGIIVAKQ